MARIEFITEDKVKGKAKDAYKELESKGKLTNMKKALLQDYGTYSAFMGWYSSWESLTEVIGQKSSVILAHAVSTTNGCLLCSLFFISDLKELGLEPSNLILNEKEELLVKLAEQVVKDPTRVSDEIINGLKKYFSDSELVTIVGFVCQMIATNNFNSVFKIDVDERLLPLKDEFKPATWR